jgi:hypothetical protein
MMCDDFFSPNAKTEEHAKWLKTFGWLLTEPQQARVDDALKKIVVDSRAALFNTKCIADIGAGVEIPQNGSASASSSGSQAGAMLKASALVKGISSADLGKESTVEPASKKEARARLLSVLRGKSKQA